MEQVIFLLFLFTDQNNVDLTISEVVDQSSACYPFRCYIDNLLSFGSDSQSTFLRTAFYDRDIPGTTDRYKSTGGVKIEDSGYMKRRKFVKIRIKV